MEDDVAQAPFAWLGHTFHQSTNMGPNLPRDVLRQNTATRDLKRMLEEMRHTEVCKVQTACLKKKLAKNRKQLKAAKRRITAVSKEKAGLEQELALKSKKLSVRADARLNP